MPGRRGGPGDPAAPRSAARTTARTAAPTGARTGARTGALTAARTGARPAARTAARPAARSQPHPLVALVGRLLLVQSGATAVISLAFWRRSVTWLLFALMLAVLLGCLSGLARTGTHLAWVAAVVADGAIALLGLVRAMSLDYLGGTLFAIITLGVLLHPAVGRAFTATGSRQSRPGQPGFAEVRIGDASLAENAGGIGGGAG